MMWGVPSRAEADQARLRGGALSNREALPFVHEGLSPELAAELAAERPGEIAFAEDLC